MSKISAAQASAQISAGPLQVPVKMPNDGVKLRDLVTVIPCPACGFDAVLEAPCYSSGGKVVRYLRCQSKKCRYVENRHDQ